MVQLGSLKMILESS